MAVIDFRISGGDIPIVTHTHTSTSTHTKYINMERTYIMIKPDGVQRGLVHKVIERFEQRGFYLKAMKMQMVTKEHAEKHYADLSSKPFFAGLVAYMCSGPVVCMVWEGKDVVKTGRKIIGATNPLASEPGSLRGDFCIEVGRNVIRLRCRGVCATRNQFVVRKAFASTNTPCKNGSTNKVTNNINCCCHC